MTNQSGSNFSSNARCEMLLVGQQLASVRVRIAKLLEFAQIDFGRLPLSESLRKLVPMLL
jgi:hypothetical protein